ncbi:hypothetical protein EDC01DRAFT_657971 [Geopyxis carbonaria]|nr:hypothetical protein EDC01DRAFT_657971 [Geopyxis carbonaria]
MIYYGLGICGWYDICKSDDNISLVRATYHPMSKLARPTTAIPHYPRNKHTHTSQTNLQHAPTGSQRLPLYIPPARLPDRLACTHHFTARTSKTQKSKYPLSFKSKRLQKTHNYNLPCARPVYKTYACVPPPSPEPACSVPLHGIPYTSLSSPLSPPPHTLSSYRLVAAVVYVNCTPRCLEFNHACAPQNTKNTYGGLVSAWGWRSCR